MEVLFGMGFSMGPIVGEALYMIGGFQMPFFALGGTLFAVGILAYFFEDASGDDNPNLSTTQRKKGIMELLEVPVIALQVSALNLCGEIITNTVGVLYFFRRSA